MMVRKVLQEFVTAFAVACAFTHAPGLAAEPSVGAPVVAAYKRVGGATASLEVPARWHVMSARERAEAERDWVLKGKPPAKVEILAVSRRSDSGGAFISILVRESGMWPVKVLAKVTPQELSELGKQIGTEFRGKPSPSGLGLLADDPEYLLMDTRIDGVDVRALWLSYVEDGKLPDSDGPSHRWKTRHWFIPRDGYELEVVMSYSERDEAQWLPVMRHALQTLHL